MRRLLLFSFLLLWRLGLPLSADEPRNAPTSPPSEVAIGSNLASLKTIADPLAAAIAEVDKLRDELNRVPSEEARQAIQARISAGEERVRQLRGNFRDILGGAEAAEYEGVTPTAGNFQEQIAELVQPFLNELRDVTSRPRELDALRKSLFRWRDRKQKAESILVRIDTVTQGVKDPALVTEIRSARQLWTARETEAIGQIGIIEAQIADREKHQKSLWENLSQLFSRFFRIRGLNLLLALATGFLGFVVTSRIYQWLRRHSPVHRDGQASLISRISDILAVALAMTVSILGILLVFYIRGDWLLLTLVVVFLAGAAWAGKNALPPYLEQIRMLLNLGSVREGERVIHLGLPWRVQSIGVFTILTNPSLQGGILRIPIRDVMPMTSRQPDPREPWFPTEPDEWAILSDGTYGKVITQTPEQVVFLRLGGSMKTLATANFLAQAPEKLSHGFRITSTFGIDYQHQTEATGSIPGVLAETLQTALAGEFGREAIRSIQVELSSASASSLDYQILADFDGSLASRYNSLQRRIQHICVEACNANGWVIPFPQITVHQADGAVQP